MTEGFLSNGPGELARNPRASAMVRAAARTSALMLLLAGLTLSAGPAVAKAKPHSGKSKPASAKHSAARPVAAKAAAAKAAADAAKAKLAAIKAKHEAVKSKASKAEAAKAEAAKTKSSPAPNPIPAAALATASPTGLTPSTAAKPPPAATEDTFEARQKRVMAAPADAARRYGQHFITAYYSAKQVAPLVERGLVGGIFVGRQNLDGRSLEDVRKDIAHLQALRKAAGLPPLIVAADQEGGFVAQLTPPLKKSPGLGALASLPPAERREKARAQGAAMGAELARLGVNVDFAPVVDLRIKPPSGKATGSRIERRAISADPAVVAEVASEFAAGLQVHGVEATLKHFPGLGRVTQDTHEVRARLDAPAGTLTETDWQAFRATLKNTRPLVMASHAVIAAIDAERPVSQSKPAISGLLREQWGFDGIVVTDDLGMGAVNRGDVCAGVTASLNAGADWLLVASAKLYWRLMDCLLTAASERKTDEAMVEASKTRQRVFFERWASRDKAPAAVSSTTPALVTDTR